MKTVMTGHFAEVPRADIPRSSFNLSHGRKTTFDADYLIPVMVQDIIPGDVWNVKMTHFTRLATPIHPIMDNIYLESFFFFVPYRLLWQAAHGSENGSWEKFMGEQENPGDSIDYTVPIVSGTNVFTGEGSLWDYFGLPLDDGNGAHIDPDDVTVSALPFRAYTKIWNDWFRDENLQTSYNEETDDGPDTLNNRSVAKTAGTLGLTEKRGKRFDYFTGSLPSPQKGDATNVPLSGLAAVTGLGIISNAGNPAATAGSEFLETDNLSPGVGNYPNSWTSADNEIYVKAAGTTTAEGPEVYADLSNITGAVITINDLRLAFQTQRLLERDARAGTRYNELLLSHWGVSNGDLRLQRPQFLGGGSSIMNLTPVAQTTYQGTPTNEDAKGNLAAFGTSSGQHSWTEAFAEHGVLIGLVNARADITYSQGIDRYWGKQTRYDFFFPVLSQIGEQAVTVGEIYVDTTAATMDDVWGYQERYAEYRVIPSKVTNLMAPEAASSLASWHLSEEFTSEPALGATFIESNTGTPLDRAIAVSTEPHFISDMYFDIKAARPMPMYGVPGNLDHL